MAAQTYVYSFRNVVVTIDGIKVNGFWEGDDAVTLAPNSDNATYVAGADGSGTVSYSADDAVRVTLRLKPESPANRYLETLFRDARQGDFGAGVPISVRNVGNGEGGSAANAHVMIAPERAFGASQTVREWTLIANPWVWNEIQYEELEA